MIIALSSFITPVVNLFNDRKDIIGLIIFAVCIGFFIWDKLPMSVSAIGGCVLMVVCGVCNFSTAFGQFASKTVVLLIGIMIIGTAVSETGLANKIGKVLIKFSGKKERVLLAVAYLLAAGLSVFLTNATVLAIFMPIIIGMAKDNKNIKAMNLIIPITLASNMGGLTTLIGSSQQMSAQGILEELDILLYGNKQVAFNIFDMLPMGLILVFAGLVYCLIIGLPLGNKIWGNRDDSDCEITVSEVKAVSRGKTVAMYIILGFMFTMFILNTVISFDPTLVVVIAALACLVAGCCGYKKAYSSVNWNIVLRLGGCLGLVKAIDAAGSMKIISSVVSDLGIDKLSPFLIFVCAVFIAQALSLIISNSTAITLVLTIVLAMPLALKLNPTAYAMGIVFGASMGMCCPLSGSTWGMSMSAGYKFKDYFKYGIAYDIFAFILIVIFVPLFFPLTLA